jgi:hypothetical protein
VTDVEVAPPPVNTDFDRLRRELLPPQERFNYFDESHIYTFGGTRTAGASTTAKIPSDSYLIEAWTGRQILIGAALDPNITENTACFIDNTERLNKLVEEAKRVAGAHRKADRGTQAHRSLELTLLGRESEFLTKQQRDDARALRNTLDAYELESAGYAERFVLYPDHPLAGRFDAILRNRDGQLRIADLKTGLNAIRYPHTTVVQLAFYAYAPWVSAEVEVVDDKTTVTRWERLPEELDKRVGLVLQLEPGAEVGEFYEVNIGHGWAGAQLALGVRDWRRDKNGGEDLVRLAKRRAWTDLVAAAQTRTSVRLIWKQADAAGELTEALRDLCNERGRSLPADT